MEQKHKSRLLGAFRGLDLPLIESLDIPDEYVWATVMAIAMDPNEIRQSPGPAAEAAAFMGYMKSSVCVSALSIFIRELGYKAIAAVNAIALSIPLAVEAGLGEMGRNAMLITPDFGPCVRLCKLFTDLPLEPHKPITIGVTDSCRECDRCARACPEKAIDDRPEPRFDVVDETHNRGVLRWPVDGGKCGVSVLGCSTCIAVCPFTPNMIGGSDE